MEYSLEKSCCIIGHRDENLHYTQDRLAYLIYEEIYRAVGAGYDTFYFSGCSEIDIIAAEQVLLRRVVIQKGDPKHIHLNAVLPYDNHADDFSCRERYDYILSRCDKVIILHTNFTPGCYEECSRYMADRCSRLIAIYDGMPEGGTKDMIIYAGSKDIDVIKIPVF